MLELTDVHVRYGNIRALQGVSLRVDTGELVALIGSNGAGKSTTLRTISGLLRPTQGTIRFEGTDITTEATDRIVAMGISHCPEGRHIFGSLTVAENLRLGAVSRSDTPGIVGRPRDGLRPLPDPQGAHRPGRRDAVGWGAADARDRPSLDEPPAIAAPRRALARARTADGRADLRDDRRPQGGRA